MEALRQRRHRRTRNTTDVDQTTRTFTPARGESTVNAHRTTAKVVGALYLVGMVVGIGGLVLIQSVLSSPDHLSAVSSNAMLVAVGALLWLIAVAGDTAHGVLMFPVLKPHSERIAVGYLGFRVMDAVFIAVMVLFILVQIPIAGEYLKAGASDAFYLNALSNVFMEAELYAYNTAMLTLGIASLMLCYTLYRAQLVPRFVAVWGLVGYATILCGSVLELMGFDLLSIHALPGGLWELFIGVWLIAKGFNSPAIVAERDTTDTSKRDQMNLARA